MSKYEVTVPVTVTVVSNEHGFAATKLVFGEFGGFFSEAEEAGGVWDVDEEGWGHDDQETIATTAHRFIRESIGSSGFIADSSGALLVRGVAKGSMSK
jgi:hypothetical protein